MKLLKPSYKSDTKQYCSKVEEGIRLTSEQESGILRPTLQEHQISLLPALIPQIIESTKGWFTKPLTQEWLQTRCELGLPNPEQAFEGKIVWELQDILISKDKFQCCFQIIEQIPVESIQIQLEEADLEEPEDQEQPVSLDPTRRIQQKQKVLRARARAARALFKAERLTQQYMITFGEDTDWEDEESGESGRESS